MKAFFVFGILFFSLFLIGILHSVSAQETTQAQIDQWDSSIGSLFDAQGNLLDIQKYDQGFLEINQKFQAWPYPLKALFNNHTIQVNFVLGLGRVKLFGIRVANEKINSFTLGSVPNADLQLTLDVQTWDQIRNDPGNGTTTAAGVANAIKSGKLTIESKDLFTGIAISIYRIFI